MAKPTVAMSLLGAGCPQPFLTESDYPYAGGYLKGRFCGNVTSELSCCLPCPVEYWTYSDDFKRNTNIAFWFNVPALVCQVLLLVTYAVLPEDKSHRHYLSIGLCISLILLELSFIVPLGTKPDECHDAITPNDMHSSLSCAWSGALLEAGSMAAVAWILLRSIWTHLRVCWDARPSPLYLWLSQVIGWGLSALFLAITLPITGVSYRLGTTCIPNQEHAFVTWFGWLLAFADLAALLQFVTTGFCLWLFLRHIFRGGSTDPGSKATNSSGTSNPETLTDEEGRIRRRSTVQVGKRLAWRRVRNILYLQWRSIALSVLVIIETIYFGVVFVENTQAERRDQQPAQTAQLQAWSLCLVLSGGNKNECIDKAKGLSLEENKVIASLFMSALIGLFTFALMIRRSMVVGWYETLFHPRRLRSQSGGDFVTANQNRRTLSKSLKLDTLAKRQHCRKTSEKDPLAATGILPEPSDSVREMSVPEAGDVTKRHETTTLFDDQDDEEEKEDNERSRSEGNDLEVGI